MNYVSNTLNQVMQEHTSSLRVVGRVFGRGGSEMREVLEALVQAPLLPPTGRKVRAEATT